MRKFFLIAALVAVAFGTAGPAFADGGCKVNAARAQIIKNTSYYWMMPFTSNNYTSFFQNDLDHLVAFLQLRFTSATKVEAKVYVKDCDNGGLLAFELGTPPASAINTINGATVDVCPYLGIYKTLKPVPFSTNWNTQQGSYAATLCATR